MSTTTPLTPLPHLTPPDPEVIDRPQRRRFSAADKLRILEEIDRAPPGKSGAILRREGLYSSNVRRWREQRDQGVLQGLAPVKPGPRPAPTNPLQSVVDRLEQENTQLRERIARAEAIIDLQKKVAQLLGTSPSLMSNSETK